MWIPQNSKNLLNMKIQNVSIINIKTLYRTIPDNKLNARLLSQKVASSLKCKKEKQFHSDFTYKYAEVKFKKKDAGVSN